MASGNKHVLHGDPEIPVPAGEDSRRRYTRLPWVDIICAGVPCQDVSVAGRRAGLGGKRTRLFYEFARLLQELRPTWFVLENVPGLLSSNEGRDFAEVLRVLMVECGYGVSWRVLDSQFFRVAQRRRRVFVVGCFGKPCPASVLFDCPAGAGHLAAGAQEGPGDAADVGRGAGVRGGPGFALSGSHRYDASVESFVIVQDGGRGADKKQNGLGISQGGPCYTLDGISQHAVAFEPRYFTRDNRTGGRPQPNAHPLLSGHHGGDSEQLICFEPRFVRNGRGGPSRIAAPLKAESGSTGRGDGAPLVAGPWRQDLARSLSSVEGGNDFGANKGTLVCAPVDADGVRDFAELPKGLDAPRYRALGNAVTVAVARWIAERIAAHERTVLSG